MFLEDLPAKSPFATNNPPMCSLDISNAIPAQVGPDEVCLWWASLDQIAGDDERLGRDLSADEQERAKRFFFERDRRRYIAGRAVLRMILARYLVLQPAEVSFRYGRYGKPLLVGTDLSFNMSKSEGCAVYAVTRNRRIGVDVERIREIAEIDQIGRQFFSEPEYRLLCAHPDNIRHKVFFQYWTRKEALVKAIGVGLSTPLDSMDVSSNPLETVRLIRHGTNTVQACQWSIYDLEHYLGFAVALSVESNFVLPLHNYNFPSSG